MRLLWPNWSHQKSHSLCFHIQGQQYSYGISTVPSQLRFHIFSLPPLWRLGVVAQPPSDRVEISPDTVLWLVEIIQLSNGSKTQLKTPTKGISWIPLCLCDIRGLASSLWSESRTSSTPIYLHIFRPLISFLRSFLYPRLLASLSRGKPTNWNIDVLLGSDIENRERFDTFL